MRFVVIQGVVINTEAVDMIVPQNQQTQIFLRGGSDRTFNLTSEEILEHLRHHDDIVRVVADSAKEAQSSNDNYTA